MWRAPAYSRSSPFDDISAPVGRARVGSILSPKELLQCARLMQAARSVRRMLVNEKEEEETKRRTLRIWRARCSPMRDLEDEIFGAILSEDEIADSASPALASVRRKIRSVKRAHPRSTERLSAFRTRWRKLFAGYASSPCGRGAMCCLCARNIVRRCRALCTTSPPAAPRSLSSRWRLSRSTTICAACMGEEQRRDRKDTRRSFPTQYPQSGGCAAGKPADSGGAGLYLCQGRARRGRCAPCSPRSTTAASSTLNAAGIR